MYMYIKIFQYIDVNFDIFNATIANNFTAQSMQEMEISYSEELCLSKEMPLLHGLSGSKMQKVFKGFLF